MRRKIRDTQTSRGKTTTRQKLTETEKREKFVLQGWRNKSSAETAVRYRANDYSREEKLNPAFKCRGVSKRDSKRRSWQLLACNQPDAGEKTRFATLFSSRTMEVRRKLCRVSVTEANKRQKYTKPEVSRETSTEVLEGNGSGCDHMRKSDIFCIRRMRLNLLEERYSRAHTVSTLRGRNGKVGQCDMRNVNKVNNVTYRKY